MEINPTASFERMQTVLAQDPYQLTGAKEKTFLGHVSSYIIAQIESDGQMAFIKKAFATIAMIPSECALQTLDVLRRYPRMAFNSAYQELETEAEISLLTLPVRDVKTLRQRIGLFPKRSWYVFNAAIVQFEQGLSSDIMEALDTLSDEELEWMQKVLRFWVDCIGISVEAQASLNHIIAFIESLEQ